MSSGMHGVEAASAAATLRALGERIAEAAAHVDAAMHRLLSDLRAFDAGRGWHAQGAASAAHWLSWRVGWTLATGREHVRVARALGALPRIDQALRTGRLSYSKVRAITRVATPATEAALLSDALFTTASQLEQICRKLQLVQRLNQQPPDQLQARRTVTRRDLEDGLVRIEITLRPDEAAIVWAAIDHAAQHLATPMLDAAGAPAAAATPLNASSMTMTESGAGATASAVAEPRITAPAALSRGIARFDRVDGVMAISQAVLRGKSPLRTPVEVVLTVPKSALAKGAGAVRADARRKDDADVSAEAPVACFCADSHVSAEAPVACFSDGTCVSAETSRRLACDASVVEMVTDEDGQPLSVGRRTRTIPAAIKRALLHRDQTCRFPGCSNRLYLDGHHVRHWADGGETKLANLCTLCTRHHAFVHEHGYRIEATADGLAFFDERGRQVPPEGPRLQDVGLGWDAIRAANAAAGLAITPSTNVCGWDGRPVRYGDVIDSLWRLEPRRG